MKESMKKVLYFDVETTGLDSKLQDIIQLAGIIEIDGEIKDKFNFCCQPFDYTTVQQSALKVNKRTIVEIKQFDLPQLVFPKFIALLEKYVDRFDKNDKYYSAGYNVAFDVRFLTEFFIKNGDDYFGSWFNGISLDPYPYFQLKKYLGQLKAPNLRLETMAEHFGLAINAHNAMSDIEVTRILMKKVLDQLASLKPKKKRRKKQ